ncbi:MAG: hypothetical protein ABL958_06420 [Bdellovibrionia bacterium]
MSLHRWAFIIMVFCASTQGFAQTPVDPDKEKYGYEWGLHTGPLLPNQFENVTEIMPGWGARVGFPQRKAFVEIGGFAARAYGVSIYNGSISYRGDVTVDTLTGIFYAGLDVYHITPADQTGHMDGGGHIGAGLMTIIGDVAWFRADMKFNINPATALYIGFGLHFRLPESQDAATPNP